MKRALAALTGSLLLATTDPCAAGPPPASASASSAPCPSTVHGDLRLHRFESRTFGNTRMLRVLVPAGYDAPENASRRYPVLYLLDGQNLFDACLSDVSHHEWEVDETVDRLVRAGTIPPMIVVGIDHAGRDRGYEYIPYRDTYEDEDPREPIGRRFPDFLTGEVLPFIDSRYRTLQGRDHTGIGGSSYGGAAALYAVLTKPMQFGVALIESPSLHIGLGQLVRDTSPLAASPRKLYVGMGTAEGMDPEFRRMLLRHTRQLESNLRAAGYDDATLRVVIEPGAIHTETAWARRLPGALTFLYGPDAGR
jgi:predicted alpha/beta superfamily hydrolase